MLATRLKQLLQERDMSVSELARRAGVVDNTIRQLTLGNSEVPTFRVGLALAKALGVHPEELLYVPEEVPKETLVDRMDKLEAAVALQGSKQNTGTQSDAPQVESSLMDRLSKLKAAVSLQADRMEALEAQIRKALKGVDLHQQILDLHQKEFEYLQKIVRPAMAPRQAGKPPLQASRATRKS